MYAMLRKPTEHLGSFAKIARQAIVQPTKSLPSSILSDVEVEIAASKEDPQFVFTRHSYEHIVVTMQLIIKMLDRLTVGVYMLAIVSFVVGMAWTLLHINV